MILNYLVDYVDEEDLFLLSSLENDFSLVDVKQVVLELYYELCFGEFVDKYCKYYRQKFLICVYEVGVDKEVFIFIIFRFF